MAKIIPFQWSGKNSAQARKEASDNLIKHINSLESNHQYIIAHSHGGNIATRAITANETLGKLKHTITLSTPFIHEETTQATPKEKGYLIAGSFLFLASNILPFLYIIHAIITKLNIEKEFTHPEIATAIATIAITSISTIIYLRKIHTPTRTTQEKIPQEKITIYQTIGDEADAALRSPSLLLKITNSFINDINIAHNITSDCRIYKTLVYAIIPAVFAVILYNYNLPFEYYISLLLSVLLNIALKSKTSSTILYLTSPLMGLFFLANLVKAFAYGDVSLAVHENIKMDISETPEGIFTIHKYRSDNKNTAHSSHSHPEIIRDIANRLSQQENATRT